MRSSETIGAIAKALSTFQGEVENASKSSKNPFFNSKYADLGEVLNTARPLLAKNALSLAQFPSFEGTEQGGIVKVTTLLGHESGEWYSCETTSPVFPTTSQKTGKTELVSAQTIGSATTYCRRYAAAAVLGIGQEDDDGNSVSGKDSSGQGATAGKQEPKKEAAAPTWTKDDETQFATLMDKIGNHLRVQNKLDELEDFTAKVMASKAKYAAATMLPTLKTREGEFAAQTTEFIKRTVGAKPQDTEAGLPLGEF